MGSETIFRSVSPHERNWIPGPGYYALEGQNPPKIFSKKGFGVGFAGCEKKQAFKIEKNKGPGPGHYLEMEEKEKSDESSHAFLSKSPRMVGPKPQTGVFVGPGKYFKEDRLVPKKVEKNNERRQMVFIRVGRSLQMKPNDLLPGPGHYNLAFNEENRAKGHSSYCFAQPQEKGTLKLKDFEKIREKFGILSSHKAPERERKVFDVPQGLSMFKLDNHDRFGSPLLVKPRIRTTSVGPGSYFPENVNTSFVSPKRDKTHHFFTSNTKKGVVGNDLKTANIGPAKYTPNLFPVHQSHHRNEQNVWL